MRWLATINHEGRGDCPDAETSSDAMLMATHKPEASGKILWLNGLYALCMEGKRSYEETTNVTVPHVFITWDEAHVTQAMPEIGMKLVEELRTAGAEVIVDDHHLADQQWSEFLKQALRHCDWLIVLQTRATLQSPRVQTVVSMVGHMQMKGVLCVQVVAGLSADERAVPVHWHVTRSFDASQDYPRALCGLLLELGLIPLDEQANGSSEPPLQQETGESAARPHQEQSTGDIPPDWSEKRLLSQPSGGRQPSLRFLQRLRSPRLAWVAAPIALPRYMLVVFAMLIILVLCIANVTFTTGSSAGFHAGNAAAYASAHSSAVAFVDTHATAIADAAIKSQDPYPLLAQYRVALNDPLLNSNHSSTWIPSSTTSDAQCSFPNTNTGYEVRQFQGGLAYCVNTGLSLTNFIYQVTMTLIQGDQGGLIFCVNNIDNNSIHQARFYYFHIKADANSSNWTYEVGWIDFSRYYSGLIRTDHSPYIHSQFGQANLLAVAVDNGMLTFYLNRHNVYHTTDTTYYTSGTVGVFAKDDTHNTDILFRNAIVWDLAGGNP